MPRRSRQPTIEALLQRGRERDRSRSRSRSPKPPTTATNSTSILPTHTSRKRQFHQADDDHSAIVGPSRKKKSRTTTASAAATDDPPRPGRPVIQPPRRAQAPAPQQGDIDSDDETLAQTATKRRDGDSDGEPLIRSAAKKQQRLSQRKQQKLPERNPSGSSKRRPKPTPTPPVAESDDEEEEDIVRPSAMRRRLVKKASLSPQGPVAPEDSDDEALAASSKSRRTRMRSSTTASRPKKSRTIREKVAELRRRRRNGENIDAVTESEESSDGGRPALYDSDEQQPALETFFDESESERPRAPPSPPHTTARKLQRRTTPQDSGVKVEHDTDNDNHEGDSTDPADLDLEDFIVQDNSDDEYLIGAPDAVRSIMPVRNTMSRMRPVDKFGQVVSYLVHRQLGGLGKPGGERDEELFRLCWLSIDDEVQGLANSKFASSVWREPFRRALEARPRVLDTELDAGTKVLEQACGACGRAKHPATWAIHFTNAPYTKSTLEDVVQYSDTSSSESSEDDRGKSKKRKGKGKGKKKKPKLERDENGVKLPAADMVWYVGSVCHANAMAAHRLLHWRHALLEWVDDTLRDRENDIMSKVNLKRRKKMTVTERAAEALELWGTWLANDTIKRLYRDFKVLQEEARNQTTTRSKGGARKQAMA